MPLPTDLKSRVEQFKRDTELVYDFTRGDPTVIVYGEYGQYPSLAKIAADAQAIIDDLLGGVNNDQWTLKGRFEETMSIIIEHNKATTISTCFVIDTEGNRHSPILTTIDPNTVELGFAEPVAGVYVLQLFSEI